MGEMRPWIMEDSIVPATQRMTHEEMEARSRIRALSEGVRVWRLDDYRFAVPSSRVPGWAYEVVVHPDDDVACNCPGAIHRGVCKHQTAVRLMLQAELAHQDVLRDHGRAPLPF